MKIGLTKHCIQQVKVRKKKETDLEAIFFAKRVFREMIEKRSLYGSECKFYDGYLGRKVVSHKGTGYKFVFVLENDKFVLITFAIRTQLDFEIGKLLKSLSKRAYGPTETDRNVPPSRFDCISYRI